MLEPAGYSSIAQLSRLIGGSDRLYRGEIAGGRLPAIFTGEWRILGADALRWAAERAERRRAGRAANPSVRMDAHPLPSSKGGVA